MLRIYQPKVLSVFTEPQNLQIQKLCSIPSSPHTPQVHPAGAAGPVTCVSGCGGRIAKHASHCRESGGLISVQVGHVQGDSANGLDVLLMGGGRGLVKTLTLGG